MMRPLWVLELAFKTLGEIEKLILIREKYKGPLTPSKSENESENFV